MPTLPTRSAAGPAAATRPAPAGRLRPFVAAHPVTASLAVMFGLGYPLMIPAAVTGLPIEPFLLATVVLGQLGGAVLVAWAERGGAGVRELFSRVLRWRSGVLPWLVALLGMPVGSLALATAVFGTGPLHALATDPSVLLGWLGALTILPLVNLWEETGWAGNVQHRLTDRYGLLGGAALTAPFFALIHLPLQLGGSLRGFLTGMGALLLVAVPFRVVVGRLYEWSGRSILVVAAFHTVFNATNNGTLLRAGVPGHRVLVSVLPWVVVGLGAVAVTVAELRGRRRRT